MKYPAMRGRAAAGLLLVSALALGGCVTDGSTDAAEGIGFREARYREISAMQTYRACTADAEKQTESARQRANSAGYLAAAKLFEQCEANLGPEASQLAPEERMRAYAVGIVDYLRGGDVASARRNLETFKQAFAGHDLSLPDGASFIDTMDLLTGGIQTGSGEQVALLNVSRALRGEVSRAQFWQHN